VRFAFSETIQQASSGAAGFSASQQADPIKFAFRNKIAPESPLSCFLKQTWPRFAPHAA